MRQKIHQFHRKGENSFVLSYGTIEVEVRNDTSLLCFNLFRVARGVLAVEFSVNRFLATDDVTGVRCNPRFNLIAFPVLGVLEFSRGVLYFGVFGVRERHGVVLILLSLEDERKTFSSFKSSFSMNEDRLMTSGVFSSADESSEVEGIPSNFLESIFNGVTLRVSGSSLPLDNSLVDARLLGVLTGDSGMNIVVMKRK